MLADKQELLGQLQREQDANQEADDAIQKLKQHKATLEEQVADLEQRVEEEVENNANVSSAKRKMEAELDQTKEQLKDVEEQVQMVRGGGRGRLCRVRRVVSFHIPPLAC